ncbi:MAG: hypothetical protein Q8Q40_12660 [Methylococcaceae bacterium]|nr:hypothetical protein [Methylococcaceae bacterium]MDP3904810.1 hypothetical protein [Methylococcaceae bacterium]
MFDPVLHIDPSPTKEVIDLEAVISNPMIGTDNKFTFYCHFTPTHLLLKASNLHPGHLAAFFSRVEFRFCQIEPFNGGNRCAFR